MDLAGWERAVLRWREQELAHFARRAHRNVGRGYVLLARDEKDPIYVTPAFGVPLSLLDEVYEYDPEHEALVVSEADLERDSVVITRIKIQHYQ